ncbi:MAG: hypothetical protein KDA84_25175, partial [Planctomycetaceae bacterium]|nr:hypothetical protein [Planctomycetaceae bacterium]
MNADPSDQEADLDSLLEKYFERRDCGESVGEGVLAKLQADLIAEFHDLTKFAEYLENVVRTEDDQKRETTDTNDPMA